MADLTRLRAILLDPADLAASLGGVLYHLSPEPTGRILLDHTSVLESLQWLAKAPLPLFGHYLGGSGVLPQDFATILPALTDSTLARIATTAHAMVVSDMDWDRAVRDDYSTEVSLHGPRAARVAAQSSVEFAALDALTAAGYAGIDDAVTAVADLRRAMPNKFTVRSHQYARSRHAVFARFQRSDGTVRVVTTPWCLSRRNAIAVAAVLLHDFRRSVVETRLVARARTVHDFAARTSLQAVRDLTTPALALLTRYSYSRQLMAFVDDSGAVVQSVGSRAPHVAVAFAAIFTAGSADPLMLLADKRTNYAESLDEQHYPPSAYDYYEMTDSPWVGLALFARCLGEYRVLREESPWGERVNKGAMLGYVARGRTAIDRNTMACINRLEEVSATIGSYPADKRPVLYIIEWAGNINASAVLAASAVAGLDVAVDVAGSGIDLPGADVFSDQDEPIHSYQAYLTSAPDRGLPRMPAVTYRQGTPLSLKLNTLRETLAPDHSGFRLAYISGGVSQLAATPLSVTTDMVARHDALEPLRDMLPLFYYCSEFLLPPVCQHAYSSPPDPYLDNAAIVDPECTKCTTLGNTLAILSPLLESPSYRLVKPRSIFAHNAHFSLETTLPGGDGPADTARVIDSAIASNVLRNHDYPTPPPPGSPGMDVTSPDLMRAMSSILAEVHSLLAGHKHLPLTSDFARQVAASIV